MNSTLLAKFHLIQYPNEEVPQTLQLAVKTNPCYISQYYAMDCFIVLTGLLPST